MVAQRSLVLLAAIFAAARSQAPVGGPHGGRAHVARYLRGREDEEAAPALHYFAISGGGAGPVSDPEWKYVAVRRTASEPVEFFDWVVLSYCPAEGGACSQKKNRRARVLHFSVPSTPPRDASEGAGVVPRRAVSAPAQEI